LAKPGFIPDGSNTDIEPIYGPGMEPNAPDRTGDIAVDGIEVPATFSRLAAKFTVAVNTPTVGGVAPVESSIVMTNVLESVHLPL
jgi:hypothetical protein